MAFIWSILPYPVTIVSQLREDLGASIYLLAKFSSCVNTTILSHLHGTEDNRNLADSRGSKLEKIRRKVFDKELLSLNSGKYTRTVHQSSVNSKLMRAPVRQHYALTVWEPPIGGKFPKETYENIIHEVEKQVQSCSYSGHCALTSLLNCY